MTNYSSHYDWLNKHLPDFFERVGVNWDTCPGIIVAHGDKGWGYQYRWEEAGIPFHYGMAIYLLTYVRPYGLEVRDHSEEDWVAPDQWVIDNFERFKKDLEAVETT